MRIFLLLLSSFSLSYAMTNPLGDVRLLGRQISADQYVKSLNNNNDPTLISQYFTQRLSQDISKEERGAIIDVVDQLRMPIAYNVRNEKDIALYQDYLDRKKTTPSDKAVSFSDSRVLHGSRAVRSNMLEDDIKKRQLLGDIHNQTLLSEQQEKTLKAQLNKKIAEAKTTEWNKKQEVAEQERYRTAVNKNYEANRAVLYNRLNALIKRGELNYSCQMTNVAQMFSSSDDSEFKTLYPDVKVGKFTVTQRKLAKRNAIAVPALSEIQSKLKEHGEHYNSWLGYNQFVIEVEDSETFEKMLKGNQYIKSKKLSNLQQQSVNDLAIFSVFLSPNDRDDFLKAAETLVQFNSTVCVY